MLESWCTHNYSSKRRRVFAMNAQVHVERPHGPLINHRAILILGRLSNEVVWHRAIQQWGTTAASSFGES